MTFNLHEVEKETVLAALAYARGNIKQAAELLGCSRTKVYRLMAECGVSRAQFLTASGAPDLQQT